MQRIERPVLRFFFFFESQYSVFLEHYLVCHSGSSSWGWSSRTEKNLVFWGKFGGRGLFVSLQFDNVQFDNFIDCWKYRSQQIWFPYEAD